MCRRSILCRIFTLQLQLNLILLLTQLGIIHPLLLPGLLQCIQAGLFPLAAYARF